MLTGAALQMTSLQCVAGSSNTRATKETTYYNIHITNQLGAKMHIITFTNSYGCKRVIELPAEQIKAVLELCTTLQNEKINYSHIFEE